MKASELIELLKNLIQEHGDKNVFLDQDECIVPVSGVFKRDPKGSNTNEWFKVY